MKTGILHPGHLPRPNDIPTIMLHGYGSHEADLFSLHGELPPEYYPIALRGYLSTPFGGYAWYPLHISYTGDIRIEEDKMLDAAWKLAEDIRALKTEFNIKKPVTLIGFSQGSIISYLLMALFPEEFKNIVAWSGYIHEPVMPEPDPEDLKHLRIFSSHGLYDDIIPIQLARKISPWLKRYHIKHIYKEYPAGHFLIPENIEDAMIFLKKNKY